MKPWELIIYHPEHTEEELLKSWAALSPRDFYFALQEVSGEDLLVYIVPSEFFHFVGGYIFGDSMPIVHFLPDHLTEIFEATYETKEPRVKVMNEMLARKFIWSSVFQEFIDKSNVIFGLLDCASSA